MRTAILISGSGSNMSALIEAARDISYPAQIDLVISNRPEALGIARARDAGIPTVVIDHRAHAGDRMAFERAIDRELRAARIELICLAGFMRILTPAFADAWQGRLLNIHPSLLPAFKGLDTHARALAAGVPVHGCTVHHVVADLDAGPIIAQAEVPVLPGDTAAILGQRVLAQEHRIYPAALAKVASGLRGSAAGQQAGDSSRHA